MGRECALSGALTSSYPWALLQLAPSQREEVMNLFCPEIVTVVCATSLHSYRWPLGEGGLGRAWALRADRSEMPSGALPPYFSTVKQKSTWEPPSLLFWQMRIKNNDIY
jgi:hypothetical protein